MTTTRRYAVTSPSDNEYRVVWAHGWSACFATRSEAREWARKNCVVTRCVVKSVDTRLTARDRRRIGVT